MKLGHGPLARYVKLRVAHAPGMPGTFFPPPRVSDPDMHLGTCVTHVPWCMPGSLASGFLWSRRRGKRSRHSRHSRRMRNSQLCLSGKRPMDELLLPTYNSGCNNMSVPNPTGPIGTLLFTSFTLIPAWIINYIHYKVWDDITFPFPNFNGASVEVWEWMNNIIPHFTEQVIT